MFVLQVLDFTFDLKTEHSFNEPLMLYLYSVIVKHFNFN